MSYRRSFAGFAGFGATPTQTVASNTAKAVLDDTYGGNVPPEAQLASTLFVAALSGNEAETTAAMRDAISTVATAGAAAACAATGAGALAAPICGAIGGFIANGLTKVVFAATPAPTCDEEWETAVNAHLAALEPLIKEWGPDYASTGGSGEKGLRRHFQGLLSAYYTSMISAGFYIVPGKDVPCDMYYKAVPLYAHTFPTAGRPGQESRAAQYQRELALGRPAAEALWRSRLDTGIAAALLEAKVGRWAKASIVAKALADKEYAQLSTLCTAGVLPPIRVPGKRTACEEKAWSAAVTIAASSYLFNVVKGAPAILGTQSEATRKDFIAELKQDREIAGLKASVAAGPAFDEATRRLKKSEDILRSLPGSAALTGRGDSTRTILGIGLLAVAALGGVYVYSQAPRFRKNGRKNGRRR